MDPNWVKLVNCGSGLEAEILVERLCGAGVRAHAQGNDIVGLFGPGFQGVTARGVDVIVPADELEAAREILREDLPADDEEPDPEG